MFSFKTFIIISRVLEFASNRFWSGEVTRDWLNVKMITLPSTVVVFYFYIKLFYNVKNWTFRFRFVMLIPSVLLLNETWIQVGFFFLVALKIKFRGFTFFLYLGILAVLEICELLAFWHLNLSCRGMIDDSDFSFSLTGWVLVLTSFVLFYLTTTAAWHFCWLLGITSSIVCFSGF